MTKERAKKVQSFDIRVVEGDCTISDTLFTKLNLQNRSATFAFVEGKLLMVIFAVGAEEQAQSVLKARKDGKEKNPTFRLSYFAQAFEDAFVKTGVAEKIDATYSTVDVTSQLEDADTQEGITVLELSYVAPTERKKRTKEEEVAETENSAEAEEVLETEAEPTVNARDIPASW